MGSPVIRMALGPILMRENWVTGYATAASI